jgi:hypothetical protein
LILSTTIGLISRSPASQYHTAVFVTPISAAKALTALVRLVRFHRVVDQSTGKCGIFVPDRAGAGQHPVEAGIGRVSVPDDFTSLSGLEV